jgi:hypothetical protein
VKFLLCASRHWTHVGTAASTVRNLIGWRDERVVGGGPRRGRENGKGRFVARLLFVCIRWGGPTVHWYRNVGRVRVFQAEGIAGGGCRLAVGQSLSQLSAKVTMVRTVTPFASQTCCLNAPTEPPPEPFLAPPRSSSCVLCHAPTGQSGKRPAARAAMGMVGNRQSRDDQRPKVSKAPLSSPQWYVHIVACEVLAERCDLGVGRVVNAQALARYGS